MSVLVEALSLVVPRLTLDVSYPGGSDAFLQDMCDPACPARLVCADDSLVSASFLSPNDALVVSAKLVELGLVELDENHFYDLAYVDQHHGPTMPCNWLEWKRHRDGFTYAWLAGKEPGDIAAPVEWTPEQSRRLVRSDIRDEPGRAFRLAAEDGLETWLDFKSGEVTVGLPQRDPETETNDAESKAMPMMPLSLMDTVTLAFDEAELKYLRLDENSLSALVTGAAAYTCGFFVDDATQQVTCLLLFGSRAPGGRRSAVAEALVRANYSLHVGGFDLDFSDGEVRFRVGIDIEGGTLTTLMVRNMIGVAVASCNRYHDAIMAVMFGGADPAEAIAGAGE